VAVYVVPAVNVVVPVSIPPAPPPPPAAPPPPPATIRYDAVYVPSLLKGIQAFTLALYHSGDPVVELNLICPLTGDPGLCPVVPTGRGKAPVLDV
jgi:hypothetical protein